MISEQTKVRCRAHMGYQNATSTSTFVLGVPAATQTQFMIEGAWARILPGAESLFLEYLDRLDAIEAQIVENTENVAVTAVDEIKLREDEFQQLIKRYQHWQGAIGNMIGVMPNPFDMRPWLKGAGGQGSSINVPVIG